MTNIIDAHWWLIGALITLTMRILGILNKYVALTTSISKPKGTCLHQLNQPAISYNKRKYEKNYNDCMATETPMRWMMETSTRLMPIYQNRQTTIYQQGWISQLRQTTMWMEIAMLLIRTVNSRFKHICPFHQFFGLGSYAGHQL